MKPVRRKWNRVAMGLIAAVCLVIVTFSLGCSARSFDSPVNEIQGGDPARGRQAVVEYGCPACHTIPGIPEASATVGPPLDNWANRQYIAGSLTNTPDNLLLWIQDPQRVEPGTAMPNTGVTDSDGLDIIAYLYSLTD